MKLRSWGTPGRVALCGVALLLLASLVAPSAWAAKVTGVRVGDHPNYTRLVFELDSFVGYQIEQHGSALVIKVDAGVEAGVIKPKAGLIESIEMADSGKDSAFYVQLKRGGLKLKEMTLANPPRIVIDVLVGAVVDGPIAEQEPTAEATQVVASTPAADEAPSETTDSAPTPEMAPTAPVVKLNERAAPAAVDPISATKTPSEIADSRPADRALAVTKPPAVPSARKPTPRVSPTSKPSKAAARAAAKPKPTFNEEEPPFGGPIVWAAAGVGIVLLAAAALVIRRRSSESEFDEEDFEDGLESANPFADLSPESNETLPSFAEPAESAAEATQVPDFAQASQDSEPVEQAEASEPVPFGSPVVESVTTPEAEVSEEGEATEPVPFGQPVDMGEFDTNETVVAASHEGDIRTPLEPPVVPDVDDLPLLHGVAAPESEPGETMVTEAIVEPEVAVDSSLPAAGVGSVDIGQLLKEIERRVAGIETRIDEIADGRERIERQVVAQTEELRVQRAAIARTQRAVRNMSRPEDTAPTEPALRDPSTPEGPRPTQE